MFRYRWIHNLAGLNADICRKRSTKARRAVRPHLESLEERLAPAVFDVNSLTALQQAINAVNLPGSDASNTIVLAQGNYNLSSQLSITTGHSLVLQGQTGNAANVILDAGGANNRAFLLGAGTNVTFQNLTIQHGTAHDNGIAPNTAAEGGAILDWGGNVTLSNVVVQNNQAVAGAGLAACGGGVWVSGGQLTITNNSVIKNNQALGGGGLSGGTGGAASGGGIYAVNDSELSISGKSVVSGNTALGGNGAAGAKGISAGAGQNGGAAFGGGVFVSNATTALTLSLSGATLSGNTAKGGSGGQGFAGTQRRRRPENGRRRHRRQRG